MRRVRGCWLVRTGSFNHANVVLRGVYEADAMWHFLKTKTKKTAIYALFIHLLPPLSFLSFLSPFLSLSLSLYLSLSLSLSFSLSEADAMRHPVLELCEKGPLQGLLETARKSGQDATVRTPPPSGSHSWWFTPVALRLGWWHASTLTTIV